jgi:hypothetical protein
VAQPGRLQKPAASEELVLLAALTGGTPVPLPAKTRGVRGPCATIAAA